MKSKKIVSNMAAIWHLGYLSGTCGCNYLVQSVAELIAFNMLAQPHTGFFDTAIIQNCRNISFDFLDRIVKPPRSSQPVIDHTRCAAFLVVALRIDKHRRAR